MESRVLYKFRCWDAPFHNEILENFELFFASPNSFNDPFDIKTVPLSLNADQKIDLKSKIWEQIKTSGEISKIRFDEIFINDNSLLEHYSKSENYFSDNKLGVISFCSKWKNILMWSHYANSHKGFAVGFNTAKFNLPEQTKKVEYSKNRDFNIYKNPVTDNFYERIFVKAKDWKYEKEYRTLRVYENEVEKDHSSRKFNFPIEAISEVILGLQISHNHEKAIKSICLKNGIPIFKIKPQEGKFQLKKTPLIN